ncbi:ATP-dependent nuclease [Limnoglobus roseus]|uniref:DNA replication and repair protein RecF n=1 Tax=Limnoglobus roseus TaxID=2598579 RepID=A0A5C1A8E6_9BACT|nr:ATP-binding protein [Limnoglobus roseus]QEL15491.1 DNA replication and repair protein RecF [Limnoglobus roseus]
MNEKTPRTPFEFLSQTGRCALSRIGVSNFRSFGPDGFVLEGLKKINLLVGKNNAGKSNVLQAIDLFAASQKTRNVEVERFSRHHDTEGELKFHLAVDHDWLLDGLALGGDASSDLAAKFPTGIPISARKDSSLAESPNNLNELVRDGRRFREWERIVQARDKQRSSQYRSPQDLTNDILATVRERVREAASELFKQSLMLPVFRQLTSPTTGGDSAPRDTRPRAAHSSVIVCNGAGVISDLRDRQHTEVGEETKEESFVKLQTFVRKLIGDERLTIEVPPQSDVLILRSHGLRRELKDFGTGLHHLVILCAALAMYSRSVVYLEEPEVHLHPDLQRHFLRFIREQTDNLYFVTTHSNVLLDEFGTEKVAVYHVEHDTRQSRVARVSSPAHGRSVLRDLGYSASDLLQTNGVIWVEGPSDRIYLLKWLKLVDDQLIENLHFSFAFLGGSSIKHFGFDDVPPSDADNADGERVASLIEIIRINPNHHVVIDRDEDEGVPPTKAATREAMRQLGDKVWLTAGREVENYVPVGCIQEALGGRYARLESLTFGASEHIGACLHRDTSFPKTYDKVSCAREFTAKMNVNSLLILDLRAQIDRLAERIRGWNKSHYALMS